MPTFIWATGPTGQRVRIPLVGNPPSTAAIAERLVSQGITNQELSDVAFSMQEPRSLPALTVEERQLIAEQSIHMPPFPKPNENLMLPGFSEVALGNAVTLKKIKEDRGRYCMQKRGESVWIDILSLPERDFQNPADYEKVHGGSVALRYGKIWKLVDQQNITPEMDQYERISVFKSGITKKTTLEIEATLGYEGFGASASLRTLFRSEFEVTEEQQETEKFTFTGEPGKIIVFGLWQECDIFMLEIDGKRQNDPVFSLDLLEWSEDRSTPFQALDGFDGILNTQSRSQGHPEPVNIEEACEGS